MNRVLSAALILFANIGNLSADQHAESADIMKNGSFEEIVKTPKGSSRYLLDCIRKGWDFGKNPVVSVPRYWTPGGVTDRISFRIIDKNKPGEEKNVRHGNKSICVAGTGNFYCYNEFYPGNYRLSVWVKGKGKIAIICLSGYRPVVRGQRARPSQRKVLLRIKAEPEWKEYTVSMPMGYVNPPCDYNDILIAVNDADPVYLDHITLKPVKEEVGKR